MGKFGMTTNDDERRALNKKMTRGYIKPDYNAYKFGCAVPDIMTHEMEWTFKKKGIMRGKCKNCGEVCEI